MPSRRSRRSLRWSLLLAAALVAPARLAAQQSVAVEPTPEDRTCLGFSFGQWAPALDWKEAGHVAPKEMATQHAPDGRDWASSGGAGADTLMLFPQWWPAGVAIVVPTGALVRGDTVAGRAYALVADGRRATPQTTVRAWKVPCGRKGARP
jgi:hypothetical protein